MTLRPATYFPVNRRHVPGRKDLASMECLMAIAFMVASGSSTSAPCSNCDGNNVTCVDGVCLPRCVSGTSSGQCLQCLDSRFYGKQCEHDCPDTCLNSRCQMDNTRVVCTEGCVAGKKGDNCGTTCPTACTQCERYGDGCTGPCQDPRYYGPHCRTPCSSSCTDGCNRITGECGSCEPGYTGDKYTGECDSCEPGYTGKYCNDSCPSQCTECQQHRVNCIGQCHRWYYHGNNCTLQCPVQCRGCVKETGLCVQCAEQHCRAGCGDQCTPCKGEDCHSQTCKMICPANCVEFNFFSKTCNTPCINKNYFGEACNVPCFDKCDTCDKHTGKCISCKLGLRGELCDDTCPSNCTQCERYGDICIGACPNSGYYGRDCSIQCPVSCEGCHKATGLCMECAEGFSRTHCDEICSPCSENTCYRTPCRKRKTDHTVAITTGTVAVVIVLALIIAFWRHTQKGNRILGSGTNGTTHSEYSDSLAHRYWEIGDNYESGQTSPPQPEHAVQPALPLTEIPHRRLATRNLLTDGQQCQRKSSSLSETRAVSEPELIAPDAAVGGGVVRASSLLLLGGTSAGSDNESQYQSRQEVGDADMVMSEQIERLTRKTASIIFIEENCDLSNVCVKYLATNKVEDKSSP
ncbi:multiple epidermal growth factor-like domains protein 11 [Haliotis cracherodii]|uniref:multiple epidermal growth factor-like domains protein 11 n=1 Tax=Haliotis cracherodii TaxID=6455 RepID=UPI0039E8569A